jgi:hypothetical protein
MADLFALDDPREKPQDDKQHSKSDDLPLPDSREALFDLAPGEGEKPGRVAPAAGVELPESRDALFGAAPESMAAEPASGFPLHGYFQAELGRIYASPAHWSKVLGRLELGTQGRLDGGGKWKLSGRIDYNAVYDLDDYYASNVRDDQRTEFQVRETYVDFSAADLEWRLGRQHIVWGEMVGLFFADVVSAKDLREFVLPDFEVLRIPQWAARVEHFGNNFHAELIWIPFPSYNEVGKPTTPGGEPGADYFAYPAFPAMDGANVVVPNILSFDEPPNSLSHTNYGLRLSRLTDGWDITGFLYSSMDSMPTYRLEKKTVLAPGVISYDYRAEHKRIHQAGGTIAKDLGSVVMKGEAIYTHGRRYNVLDANEADGLVKQNTLDWVVGLDFNPGVDVRLNTQLFQRIYFDHDDRIVQDRVETGASLLANYKFAHNWEVDALLIHSLNRSDWLFRPKLIWNFQQNWRLTFGADVFSGPEDGLFGQFDDRDRVYGELRYDF